MPTQDKSHVWRLKGEGTRASTMSAAQQKKYAQRQERDQWLQAAYQKQLKEHREMLEEQAKAKGEFSAQMDESLNQMAAAPKSMTIADFFRAIYDLLPDRWTTFAAMLELYRLYRATHDERQAAVLGAPRLTYTPMMAPYCDGGKSVVDAVFAKAEAQEARTSVACRGRQ